MKDIKELKCTCCGATWENLMFLDYDDVIVEDGQIMVVEKYECLDCETIHKVEFEATVNKITKIK